MKPILSVVAWLALALAATPAPATTRLHLKDGTVLEGVLGDRGTTLVLTTAGDRELTLHKAQITRVEAEDPILTAEFLIRDFIETDDPDRRERILAALEAIPDLTPAGILEAASRSPHRLPHEAGRLTIRVALPGAEANTSCTVVVPDGYDPSVAWPLWISMHGTGGSGNHNASLLEGLAHDRGFLLACPTEFKERHGKGWGYSEPERNLTLAALDAMKRRFHVDPDRVYLNGWSRGGHASYDIAEHHPHLFAGINPIIGAPRAHFFGLLRNLRPIRCYVMNGALDQDRLVFAAREGTRRLRDIVKARVTYFEDPQRGHEFLLDQLPAAVDELLTARRNPHEPRVELASVADSSHEGHWIRIEELEEEAYRPGATIKVRNLRRTLRDEEKKTRAVQNAIYEATAHVEAKVLGSRIVVKAHRVKRFTVLVHEALVDLDRSLRVTVNGKTVFRGKVERDVRYLLEGLRDRLDPKRLFWNEVEVTVP